MPARRRAPRAPPRARAPGPTPPRPLLRTRPPRRRRARPPPRAHHRRPAGHGGPRGRGPARRRTGRPDDRGPRGRGPACRAPAAPTTEAPEAEAPPATEAPEAVAPPASAAPTTEAPPATEAPEAAAPPPAAEAPATTEAPPAEAPTTAAPPAAAPEESAAPPADAGTPEDQGKPAPEATAPEDGAAPAPEATAPEATAPEATAPDGQAAPEGQAGVELAPSGDEQREPMTTPVPEAEAPAQAPTTAADSGAPATAPPAAEAPATTAAPAPAPTEQPGAEAPASVPPAATPAPTEAPSATDAPTDAPTATDAPTGEAAPGDTTADTPEATGPEGTATPAPADGTGDENAARDGDGDSADDGWPVPIGLIGGGLALAGLVLLLDRRRRAQFRHRLPGRRAAMPGGDLAAVEQRLRAGTNVEAARLVDAALRAAAAGSGVGGPPELRWVESTADHVTLVVAPPGPPPPGFADDGEGRWRTAVPVGKLADLGASAASPAPALVPLGTTEDGTEVLVDIEASGVLSVRGDDARVEPFLRSVALAAATAPWTEQPKVLLVGLGGEMTALPWVDTASTLGVALVDAENRAAEAVSALRDVQCQTTAQARAAGTTPDAWEPLVVVSSRAPLDERFRVAALAARPGHAVAVVCPPGEAAHGRRVDIDGDGWLTLADCDLRIRARQLDEDDTRAVVQLLDVAADLDGVPAAQAGEPEVRTPPPLAAHADVGDIDDEAFGAGAAPRGGGPGDTDPHGGGGLDPDALADDGDTEADAAPAVELDPHGPHGDDVHPEADDGDVHPDGPDAPGQGDHDLAEPVPIGPEGDAHSERLADLLADVDVLVKVLGDVEAVRLTPDGEERLVPGRQKALEAMTYLALREVPVDREDLEIVLFPTGANATKTFHNTVAAARRTLGDDLFPAPAGGRYELAEGVVTDYGLFHELVASAEEIEDAERAADVLSEALTLVGGEPFVGAGPQLRLGVAPPGDDRRPGRRRGRGGRRDPPGHRRLAGRRVGRPPGPPGLPVRRADVPPAHAGRPCRGQHPGRAAGVPRAVRHGGRPRRRHRARGHDPSRDPRTARGPDRRPRPQPGERLSMAGNRNRHRRRCVFRRAPDTSGGCDCERARPDAAARRRARRRGPSAAPRARCAPRSRVTQGTPCRPVQGAPRPSRPGASGAPATGATAAAPTPTPTPSARWPSGPTPSWPPGSGLWALVLLGALGGLVGLLRPSTPAVEPSDDERVVRRHPARGRRVRRAGRHHLGRRPRATGPRRRSTRSTSIDPASDAGDAGSRRVNGDATAVATREVSDEYWAVTVAAPVDECSEGAWHSVGTWYLEVGVARTDDGLVAISEPAIVPAPSRAGERPRRRPATAWASPSQDDEDMATTVEGFLDGADGRQRRRVALPGPRGRDPAGHAGALRRGAPAAVGRRGRRRGRRAGPAVGRCDVRGRRAPHGVLRARPGRAGRPVGGHLPVGRPHDRGRGRQLRRPRPARRPSRRPRRRPRPPTPPRPCRSPPSPARNLPPPFRTDPPAPAHPTPHRDRPSTCRRRNAAPRRSPPHPSRSTHVIDLFNNLINEAQDLITAAVVLVAIGVIVSTWAKTRALVPTLSAIFVGALVVWAVRNVDFLQEQIGEDIREESGMPALVADGL